MQLAKHQVVTQEKWAELRAELLKKEKEFTKQKDAVTAEIRELPSH